MRTQHEADRFSVYLGFGVYVGGIVHAESPAPDQLLLDGAPAGAALSLTFVGNAAKYGRSTAVRVCHVARRHGLPAWLVNHPGVAA